MSDEQRKDEEPEVEGHVRKGVTDEPTESKDEDKDEVEAHVRKSSPRHI